jgi:hypothetical protein
MRCVFAVAIPAVNMWRNGGNTRTDGSVPPLLLVRAVPDMTAVKAGMVGRCGLLTCVDWAADALA